MQNYKKGAVLAVIVISTFLFGSIVTAVPTDGNENPLDELWERLLGVEEEVEEITEEVDDLRTDLGLLERIHELEIRIELLETCGATEGTLPTPYVDSGWMDISKGDSLIFGHGLGSLDYIVHLQSRYDIEEGDPITPPILDQNFHNWEHGGDWTYSTIYEEVDKLGVWYEAYSNTVVVMRAADDPYSDQVRIRIWKTN